MVCVRDGACRNRSFPCRLASQLDQQVDWLYPSPAYPYRYYHITCRCILHQMNAHVQRTLPIAF